MHVPVLLQEVIKFLDPRPAKRYIDATVGEAGHANSLLEAGAKVLGIDRDPTVILSLEPRSQIPDSRFKVLKGDFTELERIALENKFAPVDGVLFDLGLGSHQLDDPPRGFSFQKEGLLDMRYDPSGKIQNASYIVNEYSEKEMIRLFEKYGEEYRHAKRVAKAIVERRVLKPIRTTTELFEIIKKCLPRSLRFRAGDVARRIFQALRIEVNNELGNLEKALPQALNLLRSGGRLAVISFHSLEDRIVKKFFVKNSKNCICPANFPVCRCAVQANLRILTKKPVTASQEEIKKNPRSRSAKLRAAEKL